MSSEEVEEYPLHKLLGDKKENVEIEDVQALIDKYPDAVKEKDENGSLPLQIAVWYRTPAPAEVIQLLIEAYPDAVKEKDKYGDLPLHVAARSGASVEVIQLLIKEYPDAVKEKVKLLENLPLHLAALSGASVEVIQLLIKEYPDALKEKDGDGNLPLHDAANNGASVEVVELLLEAHPVAVMEKNNYGDLPLHVAARSGASVEVIELLVDVYPDAVKEKDKLFENLPLLLAAMKGASLEEIELLLEAYPDAVKEKGYIGQLPLHIAIASNASVEMIRLLIEEYPDAVKEKDFRGDLPLHVAIENIDSNHSQEVIKALLDKYPDAASERLPSTGNLPLHDAILKNAPDRTVLLLLNAYSQAAAVKMRNKMLPFEACLEKNVSEQLMLALCKFRVGGILPLGIALTNQLYSDDAVLAVLKAYPQAAKETFSTKCDVVVLPLHIAYEEKRSEKVTEALLDAYPGAAEVGVNPCENILKLHKLIEDESRVHPWDETLLDGNDVKSLIYEYPDAVKMRGRDGRLPFQVALDRKAPLRLIWTLIEAYPQAAKVKMEDGRLPIELFLEEKEMKIWPSEDSIQMVLYLLYNDMPVSIGNGKPVEYSGSWHACVSCNTKVATAAVHQILSKSDEDSDEDSEDHVGGFGVHIHALANVRDTKGRTALGLSAEGPREEIYKYLLFCGRYMLDIGPPEHRTKTSVVLRAQDLAEQADYAFIFDKARKNKNGNLEEEELKAIAGSIGLNPGLFLKGANKESISKEEGANKESISKEEFVAICKRQLGDGPREVVIKLIQNEDHWERERKARDDFELNPNYVVSTLPNIPSGSEIDEAVGREEGGLDAIKENYLDGNRPGTYAIVMDAADRNLFHIFHQERPQLEAVRVILRQVFEAVQHLHEKGLMHGDIKMVNIVRFHIDNKFRLIDFDASAKIMPIGGAKKSFAAAKFSSAILPPEMIERIETDQVNAFQQYWETHKDKDLYEKVKPKLYEDQGIAKANYVVKSFRTEEGKPVLEGLPYTLEPASESIDAWSLGVLAFTLLTGETLIPSNRDDDCASGDAMHVLYSWGTQKKVSKKLLKKICDEGARDLVKQLLQHDPEERPPISSLLKDHHFFHPQSVDLLEKLEGITTNQEVAAKDHQDDRVLWERMDANILDLKKLNIESKAELRRTRHVLMKGIFEATEVNTPTTFIVLNEKLPEVTESSEEEAKKILEIVAAEDGSGVSVKMKDASLAVSAEGVDIDLEGKLKEYREQVETGMKWAKCIKEIGFDVAVGDVGKAFDTIKEGIKDLLVKEEMYLYLIDELTGEPVREKGWPLIITTPSDLVPKLLPLMMFGMRAMSVYNGAAGLARMFGYPVPIVPKAWATGAQESIELLKQESSVQEFGVVHQEVTGCSEEKKSVRGASLRDFVDFMKKNDPGLKEGKSGDFAGLQRIGDPEDGTALWTVLTDPTAIENALKERAKQREEEQLKHMEHMEKATKKEKQLKEETATTNASAKEATDAAKEDVSAAAASNACCAIM